jgi:hypothetical protein
VELYQHWTKVFFRILISVAMASGACLFVMLSAATKVMADSNVKFVVLKNQVRANQNRVPAQAEPVFDYSEFQDPSIPGPKADKILALLRQVATRRGNCEKAKCSKVALLKQFEEQLKQYQALLKHDQYLIIENATLKSQISSLDNAKPINDKKDCYKKDLLKEILIDHGILENGGATFSKKPMLADKSRCWTNARKKTGASVTVCEFPLAINVQTSGGDTAQTTNRLHEYIFDLNECDLLTVHIRDEFAQSNQSPIDTRLSYSMCLSQWNQRTADAAMTKAQVELMEDTIGFCFREHLLPPRSAKAGRKNPKL